MKDLIAISSNTSEKFNCASIGFIFGLTAKDASEMMLYYFNSKSKTSGNKGKFFEKVPSKREFSLDEIRNQIELRKGIRRDKYVDQTLAQINLRLFQYLRDIPAVRTKRKDKSYKYPTLSTVVISLLNRFSTDYQKMEIINMMIRSKFDPTWKNDDGALESDNFATIVKAKLNINTL